MCKWSEIEQFTTFKWSKKSETQAIVSLVISFDQQRIQMKMISIIFWNRNSYVMKKYTMNLIHACLQMISPSVIYTFYFIMTRTSILKFSQSHFRFNTDNEMTQVYFLFNLFCLFSNEWLKKNETSKEK